MNRRSFLTRIGAAALTVVAAPLFIPAERLDFGVPRQRIVVPEPTEMLKISGGEVWVVDEGVTSPIYGVTFPEPASVGPITLADYALVHPPYQSDLIRMFDEMSPVLERLPMIPWVEMYDPERHGDLTGYAYEYRREPSLPRVEWRSLNESYAERSVRFGRDA